MEKKISLKKTTTIALALLGILTCSILASVLMDTFMANAAKSTYNSAYMTKSGVLSTDSYVLFPFQKKNLTIGFSKYGEMIDYDTKVGMDYNNSATDPWAPNPLYVSEYEWVEGWVINITYWHSSTFYNTWAFALYSDYYSGEGGIGGEWNEGVQGGALNASVHGGRKTNGGAVTDPIKILYDGPRRFVALLKTTIYETSGHISPLVSITFTIIFNKDKKQAIWFKDIKRLESPKAWGDLQIEFAERGQWDLESDTGERSARAPSSYACFFENQTTVYNHDYQSWYTGAPTGYDGVYDVVQIIDDQLDYVAYAAYWPKPIKHWVDDIGELEPREIYATTSTVEQNFTGDGTAGPFTCNLHDGPVGYPRSETLGSWSEQPMVFVAASHQTSGHEYNYNNETDKITFTSGHYPATGANIRAFYKVGDSNADVPGDGVEPCSPFTNAEWAFEMDEASDMFRACTVFGVTDRNDADDSDHSLILGNSPHTGVLDAEVKYYLNETFNPYDLYSAVHKQEDRWLKKETLASPLTAGTNYTLTSGLDDNLFYQALDNSASESVKTVGWATEYGFRKASDGTYGWKNEYENGIDAHSKNWVAYLNATTSADTASLKVTPTDYGVVSGAQRFNSIVDLSFWYWLINNANNCGPHIEIKLYNATSRTGWVNIRAKPNTNTTTGSWVHYTLNDIQSYLRPGTGDTADDAFYITGCTDGMKDSFGNDVSSMHGSDATLPGLQNASIAHSWEYFTHYFQSLYVANIVVCAEYHSANAGKSECYVDDVNVAYLNRTSGVRYQRVFNLEEDKLIPCNWTAYCSFAERVLINDTLAYPYRANSTFGYYNYTIDFKTGNITFVQTLSAGTRLKILYSTIEENEKGRYEWLVVGRDAATIDSLGAAYVSEAFDSIKDIDVLMMGMDVNETRWGPLAPFVMGGSTSGSRADYRDSLGRPHLRDDWCNTTAIASSDMIFVGGPIAQLGTEYFNEFTDAFFASSGYVINDTGQSNKILALSCWAKNATGSGYATIGIYKDLNGTIGLVIWGFDGQDTYYASKWFWDGMGGTAGIVQLQSMNRGVTSILLKITYPTSDPTHPTASIVERLGTISEKDQHDP